MIRVAQLWQTGSVDTAVALGGGRGALVLTEKPRCSAVGKHCASRSDRSASTLGQEAPAIAQLGSLVLGRAVARTERLALGTGLVLLPAPVLEEGAGHSDRIGETALHDHDCSHLPVTDCAANNSVLTVRRRGRGQRAADKFPLYVYAIAQITVRTCPVSSAVGWILRNGTICSAIAALIVEPVGPSPVRKEIKALTQSFFDARLHRRKE
jgi:hypothetical protein